MVISICEAKYIEKYMIQFVFSDGKAVDVDFRPFLEKAHNPMTQKYLDLERFKAFKVEHGDIHWNDYEMCFPIWDIYQGKL